jgi:hypothetical protein
MTLREYNNQTLLTINDSKPLNDDNAKDRGNSLRLLVETTDANKWYECRNMCENNPNCELYKFDNDNTICKLYRKEPYKEIKNLSLNDCTMFCSKDNDCDYLSHSNNNTCQLFSRENIKEKTKTSIGDLWLDFPIYGINVEKGINADNFDRCRYKLNNDNFVFYDDSKYCIPKRFYEYSPGNTTIYFNKDPVDKYKSLNEYIGLKSENRNNIENIKIYIVIIWIIILTVFIYFLIHN